MTTGHAGARLACGQICYLSPRVGETDARQMIASNGFLLSALAVLVMLVI